MATPHAPQAPSFKPQKTQMHAEAGGFAFCVLPRFLRSTNSGFAAHRL